MSHKSSIIIKGLVGPPMPFRRIDSVSTGSIVTWGSKLDYYIKINKNQLLKIEDSTNTSTYKEVHCLKDVHITLIDVEIKIIKER